MVEWADGGGSLVLVKNDDGLFARIDSPDGSALLEDLDDASRVVSNEELNSEECKPFLCEILKLLRLAAEENQRIREDMVDEESDYRLERRLLEDYYVSTRGV